MKSFLAKLFGFGNKKLGSYVPSYWAATFPMPDSEHADMYLVPTRIYSSIYVVADDAPANAFVYGTSIKPNPPELIDWNLIEDTMQRHITINGSCGMAVLNAGNLSGIGVVPWRPVYKGLQVFYKPVFKKNAFIYDPTFLYSRHLFELSAGQFNRAKETKLSVYTHNDAPFAVVRLRCDGLEFPEEGHVVARDSSDGRVIPIIFNVEAGKYIDVYFDDLLLGLASKVDISFENPYNVNAHTVTAQFIRTTSEYLNI